MQLPKSGCGWWGKADTNSKWAKNINWGPYAIKNWPIGSQKGILQINMPIGRSNGWFCVNLRECATADTKSKCIKGIDSGLMQKSKFGPMAPKRARCTFTRRKESQKVDLMWIHVSMYLSWKISSISRNSVTLTVMKEFSKAYKGAGRANAFLEK